MAILAKAMMYHSDMKSTPIIAANFLNRCEPGEAEVTIEKMSASRQFERFQRSLWQKGELIAISRQIAQFRAQTE